MSRLPKPSAEVQEYAAELAVLLGETEKIPIKQIRRVVQVLGIELSRQYYTETAEIEDKGGMMLTDNSRRRTRGGVFFHLVRTSVDSEQRQVIFPTFKSSKAAAKKSQRLPLGVPLLTWDERIGIVQALQTQQGEIKSVKVSITGRPGSVEKRPEVVITTMSDTAITQNLPRGIPTPPTEAITYTVYISPKQWERIEASLADPADVLFIDGACIFDAEAKTMAVVATSARSEMVEAKIREEQKEAAAKDKAAKTAAAAAKPPKPATDGATTKAASPAPQQGKPGKKSRIADMQSEPIASVPSAAPPLNPKLPPDVARKLNELYASASLFRQKVSNLQGKPAGQQFGLEMTQKLLKNVEDEIAALEKKYNN